MKECNWKGPRAFIVEDLTFQDARRERTRGRKVQDVVGIQKLLIQKFQLLPKAARHTFNERNGAPSYPWHVTMQYRCWIC